MPRNIAFLLALATLSATAVRAQNAAPAASSPNYFQNQAAPIERSAPHEDAGAGDDGNAMSQQAPVALTKTMRPAQGVIVRAAQDAAVTTVSATADKTELRVDHGRVNVSVFHPAGNSQILVDLPGGQTALLKDGLYTFNADTNTVRVLRGEADAFVGTSNNAIKVKEDHQVAFAGSNVRSVEVDPVQARADLLPGERQAREGYPTAYEGIYPRPYYGGFYGDPYYPYGYGWGYPYAGLGWGYGYPFGFGLGFGYYGGFGYGGFGGFRGGYGGFHGGGRR